MERDTQPRSQELKELCLQYYNASQKAIWLRGIANHGNVLTPVLNFMMANQIMLPFMPREVLPYIKDCKNSLKLSYKVLSSICGGIDKVFKYYYSVLFHEMIHSTGHTSRLGRFAERPALVGFGSVEYSKEELVAEMGASYLNAYAGIRDANFKNSLAYMKGWMKPLQDDPKMLIYAAQKAHQAASYILGIRSEGEE